MPPESVIPSSPPFLPASLTAIGRASSPVFEQDYGVTSLQEEDILPPIPRGQKRLYQEAGYEPSSEEPPVFSSDDWPPPEYVERYRRYSGHLAISRRKRRVLPTNFPTSDVSDNNEAFNMGGRSDDAYERNHGEDHNGDEEDEYEDEEEGNTSIQTIRPRRADSDGLNSEQSMGWLGSSAKTVDTEITLPGSDDSFGDFWHQQESKRQTRAESAANRIIQKAIEDGKEDVDLSGISLSEIPYEISSLGSLISQPHCLADSEALPASYYAPLTPLLRLYLGNNSLCRLPHHLFTLEKMTTLSIRKNRVRELPHWIGRLKDLQELAIGGNQISFLPWEVIQLEHLGMGSAPGIHLQGVLRWPNPLVMPDLKDDDATTEALATVTPAVTEKNGFHMPLRSSGHLACRFYNSSELFVLNKLGKLAAVASGTSKTPPSDWPTISSTSDSNLEVPTHLPCASSRPKLLDELVSKVPSLIELSLRALSKDKTWTTSKEYQRRFFYAEFGIPEHLSMLIEKALYDSADGQPGWMKKCGVCKAEYVIPAAEWIEWWDFYPNDSKNWGVDLHDGTRRPGTLINPTVVFRSTHGEEKFGFATRLPLLRRACTLACAKDWLLERYPEAT